MNSNALAIMASGNSEARLVPVDSDTMEPTFRKGDAVAVIPADSYSYEGVYAVDNHGRIQLYRVDCLHVDQGIRMSSDNERYTGHTVSLEDFNRIVIGKAIMHMQVMDPVAMRRLVGGAS